MPLIEDGTFQKIDVKLLPMKDDRQKVAPRDCAEIDAGNGRLNFSLMPRGPIQRTDDSVDQMADGARRISL